MISYLHSSYFVMVSTDVEEWLKVNYVSQDTCCTLQRELIRKKADLKLMTKDDIQGLDLPLGEQGEQLRLRECVEKLHRGDQEDGSVKETTT